MKRRDLVFKNTDEAPNCEPGPSVRGLSSLKRTKLVIVDRLSSINHLMEVVDDNVSSTKLEVKKERKV
jgi:hypothetical protein